jgi:hypothetical protein
MKSNNKVGRDEDHDDERIKEREHQAKLGREQVPSFDDMEFDFQELLKTPPQIEENKQEVDVAVNEIDNYLQKLITKDNDLLLEPSS